MTKAIRQRLAGDEGFTLIELMVVVMIIAVLIAIAIPSFLGFRRSAQDRAAQSDIRSVLLVEKAIWLETEDYTNVDLTITDFEPNAKLDAAAIDGVKVTLNGTDIVCLERISAGGTAFLVWESSTAGTYYGSDDTGGLLANCPAAADAGWDGTGW
jgi:type IV pilus assembly protein PilA